MITSVLSLNGSRGSYPGYVTITRDTRQIPHHSDTPRLGESRPAGLPVGAEPREVEASLDGVAQGPPFQATGFPIPLRGHELAPGRHEILADGEVRWTSCG